MPLAEIYASAPATERVIHLLEIPDLDGGDPLRYCEDTVDWTVTLEGALGEATFLATGFDVDSPPADDSGNDQRATGVPDLEGTLWSRIRGNVGGALPMPAIVRAYKSTDLTAPLWVAYLELSGPGRDANATSVSFSAISVDLINRDAGMPTFTYSNSPGLRGR